MARKFKFCINCRRTITESNLGRGLYVETDDGLLYATCAQRLDEPGRSPGAGAPAAAGGKRPAPKPSPQRPAAPSAKEVESRTSDIESIRQHVEAIRRILLFEKSSTWNVIAAVVQCLAIGMLIIAVFKWLDDPMNTLLLALILQVMALTFFLKGR